MSNLANEGTQVRWSRIITYSAWTFTILLVVAGGVAELLGANHLYTATAAFMLPGMLTIAAVVTAIYLVRRRTLDLHRIQDGVTRVEKIVRTIDLDT